MFKVNDTFGFSSLTFKSKRSAEGEDFITPQFVVTLEFSQMN
jgi:hypothetical protein